MDLSSLDTRKAADEGAKLQLRHPVKDTPLSKEDGSPITVTLVGADSATFKRAMQVQADRRLKANNRRAVSMQSIEEDAIDLLSAATLGWDGVVVDGKEVAFSSAAAKDLYERFPWIREQVNAFIGERANFLKA